MAALIVETGAGLANADSYCSVSFADTHHAARGRESWADVDDKEANLRLATDYMLQAYRGAWAGTRFTSTQALDWPRAWVPMRDAPGIGAGGWMSYYAFDKVPVEVQKACAELALKVSSGELMPDLGPQVESKTVGPITVTYAPWAREHAAYRAIDAILAPLLNSTGNSARVVRT